jgi:hypothetical protein
MTRVIVIGRGPIGNEYARILKYLNIYYDQTGREYKGILEINKEKGITYTHAIIAVTPSKAIEVINNIIHFNIGTILAEKPLAYTERQVSKLIKLSKKNETKIFVAFNRRFYESFLKVRSILADHDEIIRLIKFDFSERCIDWDGELVDSRFEAFHNPLMQQSIHIFDMIFQLAGYPTSSYSKVSANFNSTTMPYSVGHARTSKDAYLSFSADWLSPGSWSLEITTEKRRLIMKPIETLVIEEYLSISVQDDTDMLFKGGLINHKINRVEMNFENSLDNFKSGFLKQVQIFLDPVLTDSLCNLEELRNIIKSINIMFKT